MKTKFTLFNILLSVFLFQATFACSFDSQKGSGNIIKDTRSVSDFTGIENHSSIDVYIKQGSKFEVVIEADDNIAPLIITEVENNRLKISSNKNFRTRNAKAYITLPVLDFVSVNGSGNMTGKGTFEGTDLELEVKGSGNMEFKFNGRDLQSSIRGSGNINFEGKLNSAKSTIHGSGNIDIAGSAEKFETFVQGSGNISGSNFECKEVSATIQGSGNCSVNASSKINGKIQGSGNIYYRGNAPIVNIDRQGSGSIFKE